MEVHREQETHFLPLRPPGRKEYRDAVLPLCRIPPTSLETTTTRVATELPDVPHVLERDTNNERDHEHCMVSKVDP